MDVERENEDDSDAVNGMGFWGLLLVDEDDSPFNSISILIDNPWGLELTEVGEAVDGVIPLVDDVGSGSFNVDKELVADRSDEVFSNGVEVEGILAVEFPIVSLSNIILLIDIFDNDFDTS